MKLLVTPATLLEDVILLEEEESSIDTYSPFSGKQTHTKLSGNVHQFTNHRKKTCLIHSSVIIRLKKIVVKLKKSVRG